MRWATVSGDDSPLYTKRMFDTTQNTEQMKVPHAECNYASNRSHEVLTMPPRRAPNNSGAEPRRTLPRLLTNSQLTNTLTVGE